MKAVQINKGGAVEIIDNAPEPSLKEGQIYVDVLAASVTPFDLALLSGKTGIPLQFPYVPGGDFSGTVVKAGKNVSDFNEGDEVFGSALILNGGSGSFAQFASANVVNVAMKPKNIDFLEAASLPLVGASAIQALEDHINLQKNQKILIHGGAGGIGSISIQLAKHLGAYVATTVSADDKDYAFNLGADEIIDYKNEMFEEKLSDFDAVFNTVNGEVAGKSFKVLKKGGVLVSMVGAPSEELAKKHDVVAIGQATETNSEHLSRLAKYVEAGAIKPQMDKVFSIDEAQEAFEYLDKGSPRGKVVIKVKD